MIPMFLQKGHLKTSSPGKCHLIFNLVNISCAHYFYYLTFTFYSQLRRLYRIYLKNTDFVPTVFVLNRKQESNHL